MSYAIVPGRLTPHTRALRRRTVAETRNDPLHDLRTIGKLSVIRPGQRHGYCSVQSKSSGSTDILGDEDFCPSVLDRFYGNARETPDIRKPSDQPPPPQQITATVAAQQGVEESQPFERGRGHTNASRMLTIYLGQTVGRMMLDDTRAFFGLVASSIGRYRRPRAERAHEVAPARRATDDWIEANTLPPNGFVEVTPS